MSIKLDGQVAIVTRPFRRCRWTIFAWSSTCILLVRQIAAKMAMVGLMNTLHLEGAKYDIRVNCLAPTAGTAMTEGLFPEPVFKLMAPEVVSPGVVFLSGPDAPSRKVLCAGGGSFAIFKGFESEGMSLAPDDVTAEGIAAAWDTIDDEAGMRELQSGFEQPNKFAVQAARKLGLDLS